MSKRIDANILMASLCLGVALILVSGSPNALAAEDEITWPPALICNFVQSASGVAEPAEIKFKVRPSALGGLEFPITFAAIDVKAGTAQMIGNAGASNVTVIGGLYRITFIEITGIGNVNTTLVSGYKEPDYNIFRAVHSRSSNIGGVVLGSQHYGTCEAR